jgi:hypothetical protein
MKVPPNMLIRDASGDFGCPYCWSKLHGRVNPTQTKCLFCGVTLQWDDETRQLHDHFKKKTQ